MRNPRSFYYDPNGDLTSYDFKEQDFDFKRFDTPNHVMFYKIDYNNVLISIWGHKNQLMLKRLTRLYEKKML